MKKYLKYKDSSIEWIGVIPEHWDRIRIKSLVSTKVTDGPHETPEWKSEGIPFISAEAIKGNQIDLNYQRGYISIEQHQEYCKKSKVEKGDILFCKSGSTTGKAAMVETDVDFGIWSPLAIIRADKNKVNNKYLFQFIQSSLFKGQVETAWTFGTQPNIGMGALENLWIAIPTIEEQTQIANYLDYKTNQIETLIANKQKLIELLQEERTAIINHAVTKGINPKAKLKRSGVEWLGDVPEHWEVKKIKYLGKIVSGYSFKSEDFIEDNGCRVMKISNIQTMNIDWSDESFVPHSFYDSYPNFQIRKGDLVFALTRPINSTGIKAAIVDSDEKILLNQRNAVLKPLEILNVNWMYFLIFNPRFVNYFESLIDNTGQQPNISSTDIANIAIPLPSKQEQDNIINFILAEQKRINTIISKTEQEIELMKEYKTALISEVVTGKVDVRDEVIK